MCLRKEEGEEGKGRWWLIKSPVFLIPCFLFFRLPLSQEQAHTQIDQTRSSSFSSFFFFKLYFSLRYLLFVVPLLFRCCCCKQNVDCILFFSALFPVSAPVLAAAAVCYSLQAMAAIVSIVRRDVQWWRRRRRLPSAALSCYYRRSLPLPLSSIMTM